MSKSNPIAAAPIPPHMVDRLTSAAQRKVFGAVAQESTPAPALGAKKKAAKKAKK